MKNPTIFGPGPSIPDFHIGPQQPASDIVFGPSPMQPTPLIDFKSTNRYVKLFGKEMPLILRSKNCWTWSANFGPITASVQFQEGALFPWSAQIENGNKQSGSADVLQIERWVEDQLLAIRKTITEIIPEPKQSTTQAEPPKPPEILGMPLTWDKDSWVLKEIEALCDVRLLDAGEGTFIPRLHFIPRLQLPEFKPLPLDGAIKQLENVLSGLYEIIDLSVVQQKPGEAAKLFSKKSAWLPLPQEPLDLERFLVRIRVTGTNEELCVRRRASWSIQGSRALSWEEVLHNCSHYAQIPE